MRCLFLCSGVIQVSSKALPQSYPRYDAPGVSVRRIAPLHCLARKAEPSSHSSMVGSGTISCPLRISHASSGDGSLKFKVVQQSVFHAISLKDGELSSPPVFMRRRKIPPAGCVKCCKMPRNTRKEAVFARAGRFSRRAADQLIAVLASQRADVKARPAPGGRWWHGRYAPASQNSPSWFQAKLSAVPRKVPQAAPSPCPWKEGWEPP